MTVTVLAIRDFEYCGQEIVAGQAVAMIPIDAAVEARSGNVTLNTPAPTYQRRDMVAASPATVVASAPSEKEPTVKRRRTRRKKVLA